MEKPKMSTKEAEDFRVWYETEDPDFYDISIRSRVPYEWLTYNRVASGRYKNSVIKPLNRYSERLIPPPSLVSIDNNIIRLRQGNHAEFFLLEKEDGSFYNIDRPHVRQYYNTDKTQYTVPEDCFDGVFKFYTPWFVDADVDVRIEQPEDSPFVIYPQQFSYESVPDRMHHINPHFIPFHFKKVGSHMVNDRFGKVKRQSPMFDIVFSASDIIIERVRDFYEKEKQ